MCGELLRRCVGIIAHVGSSPRVRGTLHNPRHAPKPPRFIPACAGNSFSSAPTACGAPVHPRVCGELGEVEAVGDRAGGSSPRVRGTRGVRAAFARLDPVHPRVCGELNGPSPSASLNAGSSPRVRGTLVNQLARMHRCRFIPACAGNSQTSQLSWAHTTVHPRVCGELRLSLDEDYPPAGSSPRVRGTPRRSTRPRPPAPVHPRVCGELLAFRSPRRDAERFIPACAGNSVQITPSTSMSSVHPRVCGELALALGPRRNRRRFIPACAGNSLAPGAVDDGGRGSSPRVRGTPN